MRPEENGLWATTPDEWLSALRRLADDAALRERLGASARRTVTDEGYSARASAAAFADALREAVATRRRAASTVGA